jgi:protein-disulfide isomerase
LLTDSPLPALIPFASALAALLLALLSGSAEAASAGADPSPDSPVARINGAPVSYADLNVRTSEKLTLEKREYDKSLIQLSLGAARARSKEQENELNKLVDERVLAQEAAARKTSVEGLLTAVESAAPTDAEMHEFYNEHAAEVNHQPFETVKTQIDEYLRGEALEAARQQYRETLRAKYHAVLIWEPLREHVEASGPQRGPADARITIVEFSDFQCPYCRRLAPILKRLQENNPTTVRVVFRNLPLPSLHPNAAIAALAGTCADAKGKFWPMHDAMFADQGGLDGVSLKTKASQVGLDPLIFDACMRSSASAAIKKDEDESERLGLSATPVSFLNGRYVGGALPLYKWQALVDDELRRPAKY